MTLIPFFPAIRHVRRKQPFLTCLGLLSIIWGLMQQTLSFCLAAWLIPGAGHLLLRKWVRGAVFFAAVMVLFGCGLAMEGRLFGLTPGFFGLLKFFADAGVGLPYLMGKLMGWGIGDVTSYGYEYGNTFLFSAGLLNMLFVVDTLDVSQGRKR